MNPTGNLNQRNDGSLGLSPSAESLRLLFDSLLDIIWTVDETGKILHVSPSCFTILGYKPEEMVSKNYLDFVVREDRAATLDHEVKTIRSTRSSGFENRFVGKKGNVVHVLWSVKWDAERRLFFSVGRDITERKTIDSLKKKYEEGLIRSNRQITSILERITDAFFAVDPEWTVIYWNRQAEAILGKKAEEMIGENLWTCYPQLIKSKFFTQYNAAVKMMEPVHFEMFLQDREIWADINIYPSEEGHSIFFKDITEKKELQEQLQLQASIRQKKITSAVIRTQERERAFISKELHDNVNQVLTTIKLYNELAAHQESQREDLLAKSISLLNSTINDIRNLSKALSAPTIGNTKVCDSVQELIRMCADTSHVEYSLTMQVKEDDINKDLHLALYRILQEHLTNIMKHADAKTVQVTIISTEEDLHLRITDDGKGFDTTIKAKGIGITNMKSRADSLNGVLNVFSSPGKGSELNATFPLHVSLEKLDQESISIAS